MKRTFPLAIPLVIASGAVAAAPVTTTGNAALALAAQIGVLSPLLSAAQKSVLEHFLDGQMTFSVPAGLSVITVASEKTTCRKGDVDITMHSCELTFGSATVTENGLRGQSLTATLMENGVFADGAAGSIFYSVAPIACTVNIAEVQSGSGGGAKCVYTNGP